MKGQDGGVVSALLIHVLERGVIDAAIVTTSDHNWQPRAAITQLLKQIEPIKLLNLEIGAKELKHAL